MHRFYERVMGIYFDDLDPFMILHNARYLLIFERTLGSFWKELGLESFQIQPELVHLVRANSIEYLRPVKGTGEVRVRCFIERMGRTSMSFGFRMMPMDQDLVYARGTRTVVRVDPDSWHPEPWTDDFRARVAPWVASD